MAATDPVPGWDQRVLAASEATFGTTPNPAGTQALEIIELNMGPNQQGAVRAKRDKTQGRDMTLGFVEGRVAPIPFDVTTSLKSRTAVDTVPKESPLYKAAGLTETVNGSTSVVYSIVSAPTVASLSLYSALGAVPIEAEQGKGGIIKTLSWEFGDKELTLKGSGAFRAKEHLGSEESVTVADDSTTAVDLGSAGESYRFGLGWYQWESEIVQVTAVNNSTDVLTMTRGALSSTPAAHSAVALRPYIPSLTLMGSPISEANCTVTLDGTATRCLKGKIDFTTGIDHLPGETGSSLVQGIKYVRCDTKISLDLVLTRALVNLLGKSKARKVVTLSVVCGTGAGGIVTFSAPYCEIMPFVVPAPPNDISTISLNLMVRGDSGNDSFTMTLT